MSGILVSPLTVGEPSAVAAAAFNNTSGTLTGTTAGTVTYYEPIRQAGLKVFVAYLNGYRNSTATAQTITFPQAFTDSPQILQDATAGASVSATTLTLPASMGAIVSGWLYVVGF